MRITLLSIAAILVFSGVAMLRSAEPTETSNLVAITSAAQFDQLLKTNTPKQITVVKFGAEWCPPCQAMKPELAKLGKANPENVRILDVDVDLNGELAQRFEVSSIPAVYVYKDGKVTAQAVGFQSEEQLTALIAK